MDGFFADVVDGIGKTREARVDAGGAEVVVDLVEQVAEGGRVAVAGMDLAVHALGQALLDGLFEDGAAHDGASSKEREEIAAGGFVEVAVGFVGGWRGDDALAQVGGAGDGRLDEIEELGGYGGAEQVIVAGVEGALDGFPGWGVGVADLLDARERGEALAGVLDEALLHLAGELLPLFDEGGGIELIAVPELFVNDCGKDCSQVGEAAGARELGDGPGEFAAGGAVGGHLEKQRVETLDLYCHFAASLLRLSACTTAATRDCAHGYDWLLLSE